MKQKTIQQPCHLTGIGIHSGKENRLAFKPSSAGRIEFRLNSQTITVHPNHIADQNNRATILEANNCKIITPEHLLSACAGLGIDSLIIDCSSEEIPILDGSSKPFIDCFLKAGIQELESDKQIITIKKPIQIKEKDKCIILLPSHSGCSFTYYLDYPNHFIGSQCYTLDFTEQNYLTEVSNARTYGFEHEVKALLDKGLAQGGSLDNALIIGETDYLNPQRMDNECVKHKILDMVGDFWILNAAIQAHIIGIKSGHDLNCKAVKAIAGTLQI